MINNIAKVDAEALENAINGLQDSVYNLTTRANKHLKGYMFDSLVYRYKLARHKMTEMEIAEAKKAHDYKHDYKDYYDMEERDVMRFIEILDEAIGEHD